MDKPIVWKTELDRTWDIKVYRTENFYKGTLVMKHKQNDQIVFTKEVALSYGAMFGADVADVSEWQDICLKIADEPQQQFNYE